MIERLRFIETQIYGIKRRSGEKKSLPREGERRVEREEAKEIIGMGGIGKNSEKF